MAVKIARQPKKIALIGAPSSAAAFLAGSEKAPAALRAAGLVEKLRNAGYEVVDHGDCAPRLFADDDEHRRARNLPAIVAGLNDLKARAEVAVKSGALVLVLGGDCSQVIGLLTGARRYYKNISLLWFDRDADLNTPASTPSGRIDGMVVANIIGKGAPELTRFWGDGALVREPDVLLFGLERVDPPEQEFLTRSPMRYTYLAYIQRKGAAKSAQDALTQLHADTREFVVHLDTDVLDVSELPSVNVPGTAGLPVADARAILQEIAKKKNLLALDIAQYNPDKDPDGSGAKKLVDLLVDVLTARLEAQNGPETTATSAPPVDAKASAPVESVEAPAATESRSGELSATEIRSDEVSSEILEEEHAAADGDQTGESVTAVETPDTSEESDSPDDEQEISSSHSSS
ncbi:MAG TPA: arginase family protein [Candidatus Dormibacteraeota bacterium]|nr:arginase family protein [Candidatus Dormibacteraeota bacterium]